MIENSPSLLRRYLSTFIDGIFIIAAFVIVSYVLPGDDTISTPVRVGLVLCLILSYDTVCTSKFCTLGQKLLGIRVRSKQTLEKISLPAAYIRIVVKIILGFISFLTIPISKERRALHDFAAGSIVIDARSV
jgi:uncharacterized RDD family membrane protein YckC